ncbi:ExeM/NucH family extracellular endonuclease [Marinomonas agarivorans]|nr:ExeM/NucH family extracellular endonuclease [Marinomonas agarivorans]
MKNTLKLSAVSGALALTSASANADLIISQYVEGSSFNKVLELYNAGSQTQNLADYSIVKYQNGDANRPKTILLDSVSLAAGEVYVVAHPLAHNDLLALTDQTTGSLDFNGDDPLALVNKNSGATVDFFGQYGDVNFAKDKTFSRTDLTPIANGDWNLSAWVKSAKNDFAGVGEAPQSGGDPTDFACANESFTPIYAIQGSGNKSPLIPAGQFNSAPLFTTGIVTQIVTDLYEGFFLQDSAGDNDVSTSDAIFVATANVPTELAIGDQVCVYGDVSEFFGFTQLNLTDQSYEILNSGNLITTTELALDSTTLLHEQLEAYEGMFVTTNNSGLIVSRTFGFDFDSYRNNMVLTHQEPIYKSSHLFVAETAQEKATAAANRKRTLFVETDAKAPDGVVPYFPDFNAEDGYIRVGDSIDNLAGVIGYSYGQYRLIVNDSVVLTTSDFDHSLNDRTAAGPELMATGNLRVASFNVLNLFNSPFGGDDNPQQSNRGATTQTDFDLQLSKIAAAIQLMDADIVGLMEIENNGFGSNSAIAALVSKVNSVQGPNGLAYDYVRANQFVGNDAIAVGIIYRPSVVTPTVAAQKIPMPEQHGTDINGEQFDKYQRVSLLQTFTHTESNQPISVVVNHFKSKGSPCIEDSVKEDDVQGNCNAFRVSAAVTLGEHLENISGNILVLGDLNSYGQEDPIRVLTDYDATSANRMILTAEQTSLSGSVLDAVATPVTKSYGMTNLVPHFHGTKSYSYTYDGELGSLDHALANSDLLNYVVDADDWHINAVESTLFQYDPEHTGNLAKSSNAYSSSDHDPVIIEIAFPVAH